MNPTEWEIYSRAADVMTSESDGKGGTDGFIYLRADAEICFNRVTKRNRIEEKSIDKDYVIQLGDAHETWLHQRQFRFEFYNCDLLH